MFASVRRYTEFDRSDAALQELVAALNEEFIPLLRSQPGFVSYQCIVEPDRSALVTVSTFEGRAEAEASVAQARAWIARRLTHLVSGAPLVSSGEVVAGSGAAVPV